MIVILETIPDRRLSMRIKKMYSWYYRKYKYLKTIVLDNMKNYVSIKNFISEESWRFENS